MPDQPMERREQITSENLRRAEEIVADSKDTHEQWLAWQRSNPNWSSDGSPEDAGDPAHHERCIEEYDFVLGFLAQLRDSLGLD